ncbi:MULTISPECIES: cation:proton antiporter [Streptomyces]|uniref:Cation:proton antiporter n=1 Tax=Streptomyces lonegramiae TaxID=3075524 RepID=A0ABU2X7P2_9ACTN|nr:cation:proton antiporter [Streptomyces sp. DSM 41529]MDT0541511.1 cation:proton antiporter [Streptomyces sp. DSM 41529]
MQSPASHAELTLATAMAGVAFILVLGTVLGAGARRLRQPAVIGEIIAGIALGPSLLGQLPGNLTDKVFPAEARPMLNAIAQVGLLLFMFMIGWEFEKGLLRNRRTAAVAVSLSSVALSFGLGVCLALAIHSRHAPGGGSSSTSLALFMGAAMSITAFPVLARILTDSKMMRTPVGALALAGAAIDDVLAWCILAVVSATVTASGGGDLFQIAGLSFVYVALMFTVVRPVLAMLVRRLARRRALPHLLVLLAGGALLSAYATTWIGIHAIFGAFLFGLVTPREPADLLQVHVRRPLDMVSALLMPAFFIVTGLGVDIGGLSAANYLELAAIIAVACAGKLLGAGLAARACGMGWGPARTIALLMNTRGLTELIILNVGASLGILDTSLFTMMVIMALVTTAMAGPLLPRDEEAWGTKPTPAHAEPVKARG